MSAETQAAKVTNKCFKTSAKNSKSEITKNNNSSNGPEKSKGNGSKGTNFFDGRVGKERKNGVDRLERVEEGGEVEKTKRKLEAENRMLLELLDDTSYNNDLKKPPQKTQCSGDNVGKLCKKVHEVPKEDILVEARSMEQGAETASVKQGVKAEEMREDKREVTTDTKREEKEVKVKLKTSEELKKKLIGRSQSKGTKLFSGVKSDKSEKTGKEKNKKFAKAKSGDDKIGDQEKAIDAKGKVKEVVLEHKHLESSKGEEKGDHEEKVTMKVSVACLGALVARLGASVARLGASVARLGVSVACLGASVARLGASIARLGASIARLGVSVARLGVSVARLGVSEIKTFSFIVNNYYYKVERRR